MATFLFESIVFGPVISRRLGNSLGINLLPADRKLCSFNCVYCECGLTHHGPSLSGIPSRKEVRDELEKWLKYNDRLRTPLDTLTFAGNGEPTLHPDFPSIVDDTITLRNRYNANVKIAVLSNATRIGNDKVFKALLRTDMNILKLDSGFEETVRLINAPLVGFNLNETIRRMQKFRGKLIIQTLFFRGRIHHHAVDNMNTQEIEKWLSVMELIKPESIMIYTLARETPVEGLVKASQGELQAIAAQATNRGFKVHISV